MEDIKKNESKINDMRKNIVLTQVTMDKIKENYEDIVKEIIIKAINKEMSEEEIKNFINKRQEIERISIKANIIRETIPTSSKELSENDRNKIKNYYNTGDFTQSELADIFGVAQATISRILKIDKENIGVLAMDGRLNYEGEGALRIAKNVYPINLKLKLLEDGYYEFTGTIDKKNANILPVYFSNEELDNISLNNVVLKNINNQVIKQKKLENLFISKVSKNKLTYTFIPRNGFIEMEKEENYPNHYYIYAGISKKMMIGLETDGIVVQSNIYQRNLVCIYCPKKEIQENTLENIVLSLELLHGHSIRKVSEEYIGKKICFFIEGKFSKKNYDEDNISESILSDFSYASNFIYRVSDFLDKKDNIEKKKWKRAIKLIISFKESSNVDLLIRLFQFFDIFKEKDVNYKDALIEEFNLKESEAKFMTKIRNDLVHEGLFLDESLLKNINILSEDSNLKQLLSRTENLFKQVVLLAFYVEEIVVKYFILKLPFSNKGMEGILRLHQTSNPDEVLIFINTEFKDYEELYKQILKS
ncbi:helix-turn-helix domain-containing protein [Fusobacterium vincentii]|uniref:helix-turn-helix domain-containing protein n=1 Tax=Fusobacterium vincentii TaxID=155615 RepID=UPI0030D1DA94